MTDRLNSDGSEDGWVRGVQAGAASAQWLPGTQFRTWLFRVADNPVFDALRHRKRVESVPLEDSFDAPIGIDASTFTGIEMWQSGGIAQTFDRQPWRGTVASSR